MHQIRDEVADLFKVQRVEQAIGHEGGGDEGAGSDLRGGDGGGGVL